MFGNFCQDDFWNLNVTWNTDTPDFSSCFQDTILVITPCVIFSIIGIFAIIHLAINFSPVLLPRTALSILKYVLYVLLIAINIGYLIINILIRYAESEIYESSLFASCSRLIAYIIAFIMMYKYRKYGRTSCTILSLFWFCLTIGGIIIYRSSFLHFFKQDYHSSLEISHFTLNMIYFPLLFMQFIVSCFKDKKIYSSPQKNSPLEEAPFFSFITFFWFNKIIIASMKKLLTFEDFTPLSFQMSASYTWEKFISHWKFKCIQDASKKASLAWAIFKAFWPWTIWSCILEIVFTIISYFPPLLMDLIIKFAASDTHIWKGYLYCIAIVLSNLLSRIAVTNSFFYILNVSGQVNSALIGALFRKCLLMSSDTRKNYPSGNIISLISVDVERIKFFLSYSPVLIGAPCRMIIALALLWQYLGPSSLTGIVVIAFMIPLNIYISKKNEGFYGKQMETKDIRLKNMSEILNGIKILKLYAWEIPFMQKISEFRKKETRYILFSQLCNSAMGFIFILAPYMITLSSFATYLLVNSSHVLDPSRAFVSLNLITSLQYALYEIPDCTAQLIQTNISLGRLREFFLTEEQEKCIIGTSPEKGDVLTIKEGSFTWSKDSELILNNINLSIPKGKLFTVIGSVGCGKSSLLSALLGDMYKQSGTIDMEGSIAYVPQQAWILNKTVKENILLVKPFEESTYNKIIECCCLKPDFEMLPGSDNTEIGEKGVNISGGQKQRVSLARAVYQDADIYLLDDPLSAVDAHVRKNLFDDIIGNSGLLKRKTRILVTHDVSILPNVDIIISMKDGKIDEIGTYQELIQHDGSFAEFIREHTNQELEKLDEERPLEREISVDSQTSRKSYERSISTDSSKTHIFQRHDSLVDKGDRSRLIEEEKMEIGKVKKGVYLNYVKHIGFYLIPALIGYLAFESLQIGANIWLSKWSEDKLTPNIDKNIALRNKRLIVYGIFGIAQAIAIIVGSASFYVGSVQAAILYHKRMLTSVMKSPMSFFDTTPIGRILNRFGSDMDVIDVEIGQQTEGWVYCFFGTIGTFIVIGMNTPIFLAALIPLGIVYYLIQKLYLNASRQIKRLESTTKSPIYSHFMETIQGLSSVKAFNIEKEFIEKLERLLDNHINCSFHSAACNRWLSFLLDLIGNMIVLIAIVLAIENRHSLTAALIGLIISYALTVTEALMWLVRTNTELENQSISVERIEEYCKLPSEARWDIPDNDPQNEWPPNGKILFENYSTKYRDDLDLVLKKIYLNISPNEKVGIVGRTGAGKSSVTLALFRIIEAIEGKIVIDDIDISKIGLHALRSKLTIIPQDPVLFTGTLRLNLDPNNVYNDVEIWSNLEQAHLKDFVSKLEKGLEHDISEGGENLSVGQRQLICLARALLKRTKILILDEATAAVDMETDRLIQKSIRTEFHNHTVITIAHRLNTIVDYDKIIVMDSGNIVEIGNPNALMKDTKSKFYHMAKDAGLI